VNEAERQAILGLLYDVIDGKEFVLTDPLNPADEVVAVAQERKVEFPQFAYVAVRKVGQHRVRTRPTPTRRDRLDGGSTKRERCGNVDFRIPPPSPPLHSKSRFLGGRLPLSALSELRLTKLPTKSRLRPTRGQSSTT
jgi:hypothetical protein